MSSAFVINAPVLVDKNENDTIGMTAVSSVFFDFSVCFNKPINHSQTFLSKFFEGRS